MRHARSKTRTRSKGLWAALASGGLVVPFVLGPALPAAAEEDAQVTVTKTASVQTVQPGETFTYTIEFGCTTFGSGCTNATITDSIPPEFIIEGSPVVAGSPGTVTVDGQDVEVVFTTVLNDPEPGAVGMPTNATGTVTITVRADPDLPYSANGIPVPNTAEITATNPNSPSDDSTVEVTPVIPLVLDTEASKTIEPEGALAAPGTELTATLGATNASNTGVDSLVVSDPADPTASPNPFEYLEFSGFGDVTLPPAADQVQAEVWDGTQWVPGPVGSAPALPDGFAPGDVQGVRLTYTSSSGDPIEQGAAAGVVLDLVQRENVTEISDPTTVTNVITSGVDLGDESATSEPAQDTYQIAPVELTAGAGKSFSPDAVTAGDPTTVTLTGTNVGTPVTGMTITEPSAGSENPFESGLTFTGFGTDGEGAGIVWPSAATGATVTYTYADGTTETLTASGPNTLPNPPPGQEVVGFEIDFAGPIVSGATATVPFTADTDPDQEPEELTRTNQIDVVVSDGENESDPAPAEDDLVSYVERLAVTTDKQVSPGEILAVPGEPAVVQLPSQLAPFPESTTDAEHIVVQDPQAVPPVPSPDPWWDAFDAAAITQTSVPAGATLTVRYWSESQQAWVELPGAVDLAGPQIVNIPIPVELRDDIGGLQFDFYNPEGFPPGTSVQPNFTSVLRPDSRETGDPLENIEQTLENCSSTTATAGDIAADAHAACAPIEITPVTPGEGDLIEKEFVETTPGAGKTVIARSGDQIDARLDWSTGGYANLDTVVLSDVASPESTDVADSVFDAFDLVAVKPVTAAMDPYLTYDQVASVELWNGSEWVAAANDPCPDACDGVFPGVTLTDAEQDSTESVRLTWVESPTRADRIDGDPTAPQVGSGVARSIGNDRELLLTFEVRDVKRSDGSPALGSTVGTLYNQDAPGDVLNTASATGFTADEQVVRDVDSDVVTIIDVPLNVDVTKSWSGGPLGIPPVGTAADAFPSGRVTIDAVNATAMKVDTLRVTDPMVPGSTEDPFEVFDLLSVASITVPPGADEDETVVTLARAGGPDTTHTRAEVLAMTADDLADVVGITVEHGGRIDAGAHAVVVMDLRLRETQRTSGAVVTEGDSPVANRAQAEVEDLGGNIDGANPTADDDADITLAPQGIEVTTSKEFDPGTITEPSNGPVTLTLAGTPGGTSRTNLMTLTENDPQFFNQYDVVGFDESFSLTGPIDQVQVDAFTGGTFAPGAAATDPVTVSGGSWQEGTPSATPTLPDGVAWEDVQGLRFTFTKADGTIWENPASPTQQVPLTIERRDELRTGGPVLTDMAGNAPAPGETEAGVASNTVDAYVEGAVLVGGEPISADDADDASILYVHATNAVAVVKTANGSTSGGAQAPGTSFPYTLEVTNTGDVPIVDPVITDHLPVDGTGAQLTFDPTTYPGGDGAFAFALTGAEPEEPAGPAMPTDPEEVMTEISGDVEQIVLTFPEGTVLEVGQKYVVTIQLMFRPGLVGGTTVDNTFGVTGERPWDECSGTLDETTGECSAAASVNVVSAGALRGTKLVRSVDTTLGVTSVPAGIDCQPGAEGFYQSPCIPITAPGGDEVWRLSYMNTGNLPMNQVVAVDRLPKPGDTGVVNTLPRGSQWRPLFEGSVTLNPGTDFPTGATLSAQWTDSDDVCQDGDACPPGAWNVLFTGLGVGETSDPTILSDDVKKSVTALRFVVTLPDGDLFRPLSTFSIDLTTTTPASSPTEGPDTIAYNSVAAQARTLDGTVQAQVPATEGNKVGVALATGPVSVVKVLEGEGVKYAPDEFPLTLECTSAVGTWVEETVDLGERGQLVAVADEPVGVADLPYGADCTVTEDTAVTGATGFEATHVTIARDGETVPVVIATNTYDLAGLELTKTVFSDAVDQDGNPVAYGPFELTVQCTFLDEDVYADGYGPDAPMVVEIAEGETVALTGLPAGASCVVEETDTKGATPSYTVVQGDGEPVDSEGEPVEIVLTSDDPESPDDPQNDVDVTNVFEVGSIALEKVVDGDGAEAFGDGPFTLQVVCTLDDASGSRVVYDGEVVLGGGDPLTATIGDLATGAVCDVTETADGGATSTSVEGSPATVGDGSAEPVAVTVTNTFDLGSLQVEKVVTGEGAELYGSGPFEATLVCTLDGRDVEVPGGAVRPFAPGEPAVYDGLPIGAECTVTETGAGGATSSVVTGGVADDGVLVVGGPDDEIASATVTNTFDVAEVRVLKSLSGPGAASHRGDTFTFSLACTLDVDGTPTAVTVPGGATRTASAAGGWVAVYSDLPVGAECVLTETDFGAADRVEIVVGDESSFTDPDAETPTSPQIRLPAGEDVCLPVEVVNTFSSSSGGTGGGVGAVVGSAVTAAMAPDALAVAAGCADGPSPAPGDEDRLATTGSDLQVIGVLAVTLLVLGGLAIGLATRRRKLS